VTSTDVLIIGAGPAGTAAAITLADYGTRVMVVDKAIFPRDKCCGDGLTTGALRILEGLGFTPDMVPSWQEIDAAWVRSPSGREVSFPFPEGRGAYGAVVPRRELDAALVQLARSKGAEIWEGCGLTSIRTTGETVEAEVDGLGTVHAKYVIAADGMWSPTRKMLGLAGEPYLGEWHAFRQYAENVTGSSADKLWVWFEPDLLPGYMWSFPLPGNRANVGFGILRDGVRKVQYMKDLWPELLARPHVAAALGPNVTWPERHTAWPIPARIDKAVYGHDRVLFVGDAVAATDALTGEGIGQALLTGTFAADAITHATGVSAVQTAYASSVRHHLLADHKMSMLLGRALKHDRASRGAIRLAGSTDWTRRNFARWLFEDEPRAILATPKRWHRHFLNQSGTYR
jgi:menaquinone-9 beta-reductase